MTIKELQTANKNYTEEQLQNMIPQELIGYILDLQNALQGGYEMWNDIDSDIKGFFDKNLSASAPAILNIIERYNPPTQTYTPIFVINPAIQRKEE